LRIRGKYIYVPPVVVDELEDIKREDGIFGRAEAFKKMTKYTRVGREVNRLRRLDFHKSVPRIPVEEFNYSRKSKKGKNNKKHNIFEGIL